MCLSEPGRVEERVWWTAGSGVRRTLLAEKDWMKLKEKNPILKLKRN
jgi:hypothetical protein